MSPKIYLVGGAVRDFILNRPSSDRDYVVVGATPEWMLSQGFSQVGASFPVYLHPETGEEYALARQERKTGIGYHGFEVTYDPNVTLEDDLLRRDLTINSMAMDSEGRIIDPYGGIQDLQEGTLRHTSEAFADDPLRVLRLARFSARYGFQVHPTTLDLARKIVILHELNAVPLERVWSELYKGFGERFVVNMIYVLKSCGALESNPVKQYLPLDHVNSIYHEAAQAEFSFDLTADEKFLLWTGLRVGSLKLSEALELRIPTSLYRSAVRMIELKSGLKDLKITVEEMHELIVKLKYLQERDLTITPLKVLRLMGTSQVFEQNVKKLDAAADAIKKIDFTALTADRDNVKKKVIEAKLAAISEVL